MSTPTPPEGQDPHAWTPPAGSPTPAGPLDGSEPAQPQYGQPAPTQPADQWAPPQYGQQAPPQYGQQAPPQYGQQAPGNQWGQLPPQYNQPGYGPNQGGGGFNQTAKPGIIPLRPLTLGEIYDGALTAIRRQPKVMLGLVAVVVAAFVMGAGILGFFLTKFLVQLPWFAAFERDLESTFGDTLEILAASGMPISVGSIAINLLISGGIFLATALATGLVVVAISQAVLNTKMTSTEIFERAKSRVWALIGVSFMSGLIITVLYLVTLIVGVLLIVLTAQLSAGWIGVLTGVAVMIFGVGFLILTAVRIMLAPAVLVLEERKVIDSLKRSWKLSKGSFWRLFGITILTGIITSFISQAVGTALLLVTGTFISGSYDVSFAALLATLVVNVITSTITVAFTSAVIALLYIDLRMRREALDVELLAAANFDN